MLSEVPPEQSPPTQEIPTTVELPIELTTMAKSAKEYIDVLAMTDPEKLRRLLGFAYSVPPAISEQQIAQNQTEIQNLQTGVKALDSKFDKVLKYGGIALASIISGDYALKLLEMFF